MYGYKVSGCYGLRIKEADFFAFQKVAERDMLHFLSNYLTIAVFFR